MEEFCKEKKKKTGKVGRLLFMVVLAAISVMGARRLTVSASTMVSIDGIAYNYNDGADICGIMADDTSIKVAKLQADVFDGLEVRTCDYILAYGFHNCSSLEEVYLSDISYTIDRGAFFGCSSLKNVYFEGNNKIVFMDNSFSGCSSDLILWHKGNSSVVEFAAEYNHTARQKDFVVGITQQPANEEVAEGDDASFEVAASAKSVGTISYQWEVSKDDGSNWESIAGETSAKYVISGAEKGQSGWKYRCAVTESGCGTGYSNEVELTVHAAGWTSDYELTITTPEDQTVTEGETATFAVTVTGNLGAVSYQWEVSEDGGSSWAKIDGANSETYALSDTATEQSGQKYRCAVTDNEGTGYSEAATLTVNAKPVTPPSTETETPPSTETETPPSTETETPPSTETETPEATETTEETETTETTETPEEPGETEYRIKEGAGASWTKGSTEGLVIKGDGDYSKFTGVKVDGAKLNTGNYKASSGSTVITLKAEYLNTLSAGKHIVTILWTDGSAETTFTIAENTADRGNDGTGGTDGGSAGSDSSNNGSVQDTAVSGQKDDVPKTGVDAPMPALFGLLLVSGAGIVIAGKRRRRSVR